MRKGRAAHGAVLILLLAPLALAQAPVEWDGLAGGASRTGAALLPASTFDVLEARDLFGNDTEIDLRYSKGLVSTPHGLIALAQRGESCILLHIGDAVEERRLDGCTAGTLTAYDRENDRIIVCSAGGPADGLLQSRDAATGELAWAVSAMVLDPSPPPGRWDCRGTAIDRDGTMVVAFWGSTQAGPLHSYVARLQLATGELLWDRAISVQELYGGGLPIELSTAGFAPFGLTLTESGIVVSGRLTCACGKADPAYAVGRLASGDPTLLQGAVLWLDPSGNIVGTLLAEDDPDALSASAAERWYGQWWATSRGPLAAFALGERVFVVNAAEREPVREAPFAGVETGQGFSGIIPSAWWSDVVLVPIAQSVTAIDPDSKTLDPLWSETMGDDGIVSALLILPPSDALVLVASSKEGADADTSATLHRLDLATGDTRQRIPLPGTIRMSGGTGRVGFQPLDDGRLLLYSLDGRVLTLGNADEALRPHVDASNLYPAPSESVTLTVRGADEATAYVVAWGDDALEEGGTSWTHRYGEEGPRTARVTALMPDGRTVTTELTLRVGATPPPALTALQRAFAPGTQDVTFGVLGLLITLVGALIALYVRRRRHGLLHAELTVLERIRETGRRDPEDAVRALGAFRERLLIQVGQRRLDDAQFNTLEARANVVFSALRMRILGPLAGRLSADFRHALDLALHDGRVDPEEMRALHGALAQEGLLVDDERAKLGALIERMTRDA